MDLKDKIAVVTGGSSGIGQAICFALVKEGCKVVFTYNTNEKGADETLKELGENGFKFKVELQNENEIEKLFEFVKEKFGKLDILINNAANPSEYVPFEQATDADILKLLHVNTVSTMICSKLSVKLMIDGGKIVNTSSIKGWEHGGGSVGYAVSKAAVNSFTRTYAKIVAPNILVNAVAPGYTKTRVYDNQSDEKINKWLDGTFLKKWVNMDDLVNTYLFLLKNDSMTGQIIYVDGGFTLK